MEFSWHILFIFFSSCLTDHTHSSVRNRPLVSQHTVCQYQNVGYSPLRIVSCFFVILSIFTSSSLVHFSIPAVYLTAAINTCVDCFSQIPSIQLTPEHIDKSMFVGPLSSHQVIPLIVLDTIAFNNPKISVPCLKKKLLLWRSTHVFWWQSHPDTLIFHYYYIHYIIIILFSLHFFAFFWSHSNTLMSWSWKMCR